MSASSWIADALLGSPIPPPNWLDPRSSGSGWHAPYGGYWSGPMHVSASYVRAELDDINSCVNQPVIQGWAWCLAMAAAAAIIVGLLNTHPNGDAIQSSLLLVFLPMPGWVAAVLVGGFCSHDMELRGGSIYVRRWTDVWFGRPGLLVGSRASTHAALSCGNHLQLEGDDDTATVSLEMWPSSSRRLLQKRLDQWGIELEFPDQHHSHHPQHWHHGRHRLEHRIG
jgi:hypothetical protein